MEIKAHKNIVRPFPDALPRLSPVVQAFDVACLAHDGQQRKDGADFIGHPEAVAEYTNRILPGDAVALAGALLHDTVEEGRLQLADVVRMFGSEVAHVVDMLTEQNRKAPWIERKKAAIKRVREMDRRSLIVRTADRLHNSVCLFASLEKEGLDTMRDFNAPLELQIAVAKRMNAELRRRYEDLHALADDGLLCELEASTEKLEKWAEENGVVLEPASTRFLRLQDCVGEPYMV